MKKLAGIVLAVLLLLAAPVKVLAAESTEEVRAMIQALPTVEEFKAMDAEAQLAAYNRTQAAYDAYEALSDEEQAQLREAEAVFESLFSHFNTLVTPAEETAEKTGSSLIWIMAAAAIVGFAGKKRRT